MSEWVFNKVNYIVGWVAIGILFSLMVFTANIEIKDLDLWLHIASGRYILENFHIPHVDFLSSTIAGQPWNNHEWLFQIIIYSLYDNFGPEGLITMQVVIVGLIFSLLFMLGYDKDRQLSITFLLLLVLLIFQLRFTHRPELFSILFFVLYVFISSLRLNERSSLWILFGIQVLWCNIHGFFIVGPIMVFLGLLGEWIKRHVPLPYAWNKIGRLTDTEYRRLKQIFLAVCIACLFNPATIKGALYPLTVIFSASGEAKIFYKYIGELQKPISFANIFVFQRYPYFKLLIVLSTISFVLNRKKIDVGMLLFWSIFLLISLGAVRNIAFFAVASYLAIIANTQDLSLDDLLPDGLKNPKIKVSTILGLKILLILWMANYFEMASLRGYFDFDKYERKSEYGGVSQRNYAHKAVDFLVDNNIKVKLFNDFNSGAYLLGRASPNVKVFIDGRTEVYGAEYFEDYRKMWQGNQALFEEAVEKYGLTGAFLNSVYVPVPEKFINYLYEHKDWTLVYFNYDAAIFLRDVPENKEWIKKFAIDLSDWDVPELDLIKIGARRVTPYQHINRAYALFNMKFYKKAKQEIDEVLKADPNNTRAYILLGKLKLKDENYDEAFEYIRKAKLLDPGNKETRYQLAVVLSKLGEYQQSVKACYQILRIQPENTKVLFLLALNYAKQKEYSQMLSVLNKAFEIDPYGADPYIKIGDDLVEQKQFKIARAVYNMAHKINPDSEEINNKLKSLKDK